MAPPRSLTGKRSLYRFRPLVSSRLSQLVALFVRSASKGLSAEMVVSVAPSDLAPFGIGAALRPSLRRQTLDLQREIREWETKGMREGAQGRPSALALEPDANELQIDAIVSGRFQVQKDRILAQLSDVEKRVDAAIQAIANIDAQASNLGDTANIGKVTQDALLERQPAFVRELKQQRYTRAVWLRFRGERNIEREASYDTSTWGVLQWMVIILAFELLLNAYFYSFGVGLVAGALVAGILSAVTAVLGYGTGLFFRLAHEQSPTKVIAGWSILLAGMLSIIYLASLTATYRSISIVTREQQVRQLTGFDYTPAYVIFRQAAAKAPEIFMFPFTSRLPFEDIQSFLLFLVSVIAFFVGFWKGHTAHDRVLGYKEVDKAYKDAEAAVARREAELVAVARHSAEGYATERSAILHTFNSTAAQLTASKVDAERLQMQLQDKADELAKQFQLLVKAYRTGVAKVAPAGVPSYFATEPLLRLDMPLDSFRAVSDHITRGKADLDGLMASHLDRLRAEAADATNQARLATAIVTNFRASCESEAEHQIQAERPVVGAAVSQPPHA